MVHLQRCLIVTWLMPCETAAISARSVYTICVRDICKGDGGNPALGQDSFQVWCGNGKQWRICVHREKLGQGRRKTNFRETGWSAYGISPVRGHHAELN